MTVTIKQKRIGNYYINLEWIKEGAYHVGMYEYSRTISENYYGNLKSATNCYYRYCSKAKRNQ